MSTSPPHGVTDRDPGDEHVDHDVKPGVPAQLAAEAGRMVDAMRARQRQYEMGPGRVVRLLDLGRRRPHISPALLALVDEDE